MRASYVRLMGALYWGCMAIAGVAIVLMTLIIAWSVLVRYGFETGAFWAEPVAIFLAVQLTFFGAAACYRANAHISIDTIVRALPAPAHRPLELLVDLLMAAISLFMVVYGARLVATTWSQVYPEFELLRVGLVYGSIPASGLLILLFVIERVLCGPPEIAGEGA
ncbi:TRAP transporter small permease [Geminicoccaceae bacterium 1502E]|nr:TRAP transporter small permease [Geminicoccaceae bacterium 1502E]